MIQNIIAFTYRPASAFTAGTPLLRTALPAFLVTLGICTAFMFLSALANFEELRKAALAMRYAGGLPGDTAAAALAEAVPYNRLLFPILLILYAAASALLRHAFVRILGEADRNLRTTLGVSCAAAIPLALVLMLGSVLADRFPYIPGPALDSTPAARIVAGIAGLLLLGAWLLEGRTAVTGFRAFYKQNRGRAILTWLGPYVITCLGMLVLFVLGYIYITFAGMMG